MFYFIVAALLLAAPVFAQPNKAKAQNVPEIPYDSVPNFLKLPAGLYLGEAMGVATNSKGHIFVFTRSNSSTGPAYGAAAAQLFEFDAEGNFIREVAPGLYAWSFAHRPSIPHASRK